MEQMPPQSTLRMTLSVHHYIDNVALLHNSTTVIMFYMQVRQLIYQGRLECSYETLCRLAALALQVHRNNLLLPNPSLMYRMQIILNITKIISLTLCKLVHLINYS